MNLKFVFWKDEDFWIGYPEEYPDYMTQGATFEELKINLKDIYLDLKSGAIPAIRMIARPGDFGSFSVTLSDKGTETADQMGSSNIKKMNVNFSPGRYFIDIVNTTQFEKVD